MPRARYPVARGALEKILEPSNHQMSTLADILLNTEKNGCYTEYMQAVFTHRSCLYTGSEVLQNYKGSLPHSKLGNPKPTIKTVFLEAILRHVNIIKCSCECAAMNSGDK